jgi:hypothetical protein
MSRVEEYINEDYETVVKENVLFKDLPKDVQKSHLEQEAIHQLCCLDFYRDQNLDDISARKHKDFKQIQKYVLSWVENDLFALIHDFRKDQYRCWRQDN